MSFLTKKFFVRPKFHKSFVVLQLESLIPIYSKVTPSNVSESRKKVWDLGYEKKWLLNKKGTLIRCGHWSATVILRFWT
jgi:hypothetical protein